MKRHFFLGIIFLIIQVLSVIYARVIPERFFCWAPYDEHTYYEVFVKIGGAELSTSEIENRYHYKSIGWEPRSIYNVFNIISQYESSYGVKENSTVYVKYSINGNREKTWYLKN